MTDWEHESTKLDYYLRTKDRFDALINQTLTTIIKNCVNLHSQVQTAEETQCMINHSTIFQKSIQKMRSNIYDRGY